MWILHLILTLATCNCFLEGTLGALSFTKNPNAPKALTTPLQLTCSIEPTKTGGPISMTVGKGTNTILADLTQPDKAQIKFTSPGYSVEGRLLNNNASFITVSWQRPSRFESGKYFCTAKTRDAAGNITPLKSTLDVGVEKPTFEDLLAFSRKQGDVLEEQNELMQTQFKDLQDRLKAATLEIADTRRNVSGLVTRVEEGEIKCGNSDTFKDWIGPNSGCGAWREKWLTVVFKTPYATEPSITITPLLLDVDHTKGTRYYFAKRNVSKNGFSIVCGTWCDTYIYEATIQWQARNN